MPLSGSRQTPQPPAETLTRTLMTLHNLYETYVVPQLPEPMQAVSAQVSAVLYQTYPYLSQVVSLVSSVPLPSSESSLLSLGVGLVSLYLALRVANYIRRTIVGWVVLGVKMVCFLLLVQLAVYVNSYGWQKAMKDAGWAGGLVWGFLEELLDSSDNGAGAGGAYDSGGGARRRPPPRGTRSRKNNYDYRQNRVPRG